MVNPRNLIYFLEIHDSEGLEELRRAFPQALDLLKAERDMGGDGLSMEASPPDAKLRLADFSLQSLRKRADAILAELARRLNRSNRLKTVGSVVSAISSAGLIAGFTKFFSVSIELPLALAAFLSSLLSIFAERAAGGVNGGQIREYFDQAVLQSSEVLKADLSRQRLSLSNPEEMEVDRLLISMDDIAIELEKIERMMSVA